MGQLCLTKNEARILLGLLKPRADLLSELLTAQIQALDPGDPTWADTQHELRAVTEAINKVHNSIEAA